MAYNPTTRDGKEKDSTLDWIEQPDTLDTTSSGYGIPPQDNRDANQTPLSSGKKTMARDVERVIPRSTVLSDFTDIPLQDRERITREWNDPSTSFGNMNYTESIDYVNSIAPSQGRNVVSALNREMVERELDKTNNPDEIQANLQQALNDGSLSESDYIRQSNYLKDVLRDRVERINPRNTISEVAKANENLITSYNLQFEKTRKGGTLPYNMDVDEAKPTFAGKRYSPERLVDWTKKLNHGLIATGIDMLSSDSSDQRIQQQNTEQERISTGVIELLRSQGYNAELKRGEYVVDGTIVEPSFFDSLANEAEVLALNIGGYALMSIVNPAVGFKGMVGTATSIVGGSIGAGVGSLLKDASMYSAIDVEMNMARSTKNAIEVGAYTGLFDFALMGTFKAIGSTGVMKYLPIINRMYQDEYLREIITRGGRKSNEAVAVRTRYSQGEISADEASKELYSLYKEQLSSPEAWSELTRINPKLKDIDGSQKEATIDMLSMYGVSITDGGVPISTALTSKLLAHPDTVNSNTLNSIISQNRNMRVSVVDDNGKVSKVGRIGIASRNFDNIVETTKSLAELGVEHGTTRRLIASGDAVALRKMSSIGRSLDALDDAIDPSDIKAMNVLTALKSGDIKKASEGIESMKAEAMSIYSQDIRPFIEEQSLQLQRSLRLANTKTSLSPLGKDGVSKELEEFNKLRDAVKKNPTDANYKALSETMEKYPFVSTATFGKKIPKKSLEIVQTQLDNIETELKAVSALMPMKSLEGNPIADVFKVTSEYKEALRAVLKNPTIGTLGDAVEIIDKFPFATVTKNLKMDITGDTPPKIAGLEVAVRHQQGVERQDINKALKVLKLWERQTRVLEKKFKLELDKMNEKVIKNADLITAKHSSNIKKERANAKDLKNTGNVRLGRIKATQGKVPLTYDELVGAKGTYRASRETRTKIKELQRKISELATTASTDSKFVARYSDITDGELMKHFSVIEKYAGSTDKTMGTLRISDDIVPVNPYGGVDSPPSMQRLIRDIDGLKSTPAYTRNPIMKDSIDHTEAWLTSTLKDMVKTQNNVLPTSGLYNLMLSIKGYRQELSGRMSMAGVKYDKISEILKGFEDELLGVVSKNIDSIPDKKSTKLFTTFGISDSKSFMKLYRDLEGVNRASLTAQSMNSLSSLMKATHEPSSAEVWGALQDVRKMIGGVDHLKKNKNLFITPETIASLEGEYINALVRELLTEDSRNVGISGIYYVRGVKDIMSNISTLNSHVAVKAKASIREILPSLEGRSTLNKALGFTEKQDIPQNSLSEDLVQKLRYYIAGTIWNSIAGMVSGRYYVNKVIARQIAEYYADPMNVNYIKNISKLVGDKFSEADILDHSKEIHKVLTGDTVTQFIYNPEKYTSLMDSADATLGHGGHHLVQGKDATKADFDGDVTELLADRDKHMSYMTSSSRWGGNKEILSSSYGVGDSAKTAMLRKRGTRLTKDNVDITDVMPLLNDDVVSGRIVETVAKQLMDNKGITIKEAREQIVQSLKSRGILGIIMDSTPPTKGLGAVGGGDDDSLHNVVLL